MAPLETQLLELPMTGGLAENVDPRVLPQQGAFLTLSNLVYNQAGAVTPRAGFGQLPATVINTPDQGVLLPSTLPPASKLFTRQGRLLAVARPDLNTTPPGVGTSVGPWVYTYNPGDFTWTPHDNVPRVSLVSEPVVRAYTHAQQPQVLIFNGLAWVFWVSAGGSVRFKIIDVATGDVVRRDETLLDVATYVVHQFFVQLSVDRIAVLYSIVTSVGVTSVYLFAFDADPAVNLLTVPTTVTVSSGLLLDSIWNLEPYVTGMKGVVFTVSSSIVELVLFDVSATPSLSASATLPTVGGISPEPSAQVGLFCEPTFVHVGYAVKDPSSGPAYYIKYTRVAITTSSLTPAPNAFLLSTDLGTFYLGGGRYTNITGNIEQPAIAISKRANGNVLLVSGQYDAMVVTEVNPSTSGRVGADTYTLWTYPMSKPFLQDGILYLVAGIPSVLQGGPTLVLVSLDTDRDTGTFGYSPIAAQVCGIISRGNGSRYSVNFTPGVARVDSKTVTFGAPVVSGAAVQANQGIDFATIYFGDDAAPYQSTEYASRLALSAGGYVGQFDGQTWHENGFFSTPDVLSGVYSTSGFCPIAKGVYGYAFLYEWYDAAGNLHQSEPSFFVLDSSSASAAFVQHQLTVRLLNLTHRGWAQQGTGRPLIVVMYRTQINSTGPYYRITPLGNRETSAGAGDYILYNTTTGATSTLTSGLFVDTQIDSNLGGFGSLYTEGGVLANVLPPAATCLLSHKGRLWLASAEDDRALWYSKPITEEAPPQFSDAQVLRLDEAASGITALATLDDKVVVFTEDLIYAVQGDGPTSTGQGPSFVGPSLVASEAGCVDVRSVVTTDQGVFFRSKRGISLLTRSLDVQYVGQPAQAELPAQTPILSVVLDASRRRITWCLPAGVLVYDYEHAAWLTWTLTGSAGVQPLSSHVLYNGLLAMATPDLGVHWEAFSSLPGQDVAGPYQSIIDTPWLHVAGLSGFQRARNVTVLTRELGGHQFDLFAYQDYQDGYSQMQTFMVGSFSDPLGLPVERLQMDVRNQKCSAVRFRLLITPTDTTVNPPAASVASITLEVGLKRGSAKLPVNNKR